MICHGFPHLRGGGRLSAKSFPELADRIATELGWFVLVFTFRGCGDSAGEYAWVFDHREDRVHLGRAADQHVPAGRAVAIALREAIID